MVLMGMVIPPSMKEIMGMTTSPVFLAPTYSSWAAYLMLTVGGILYLVLKLSIPSSDSTKRLNLPIFLRGFKEKLSSLKWKLKGFKKTYRFEKGSSEKFLIFVDAYGDEREKTGSVYEV